MRTTTYTVYVIFASALILIIKLGCADSTPKPEATDSTKQSHGPTKASSSTNIPSYTILKDENLARFKRSVDIRLSRKASKEALRSIAMAIKDLDQKKYDRTFMCYYLADMVVDAGAWAITHFNPNLEVKILGGTIEDEAYLRNRVFDSTWHIVGKWLEERPSFVGTMYTIYYSNSRLYLEHSAPDGVISTDELAEKASGVGRTFEEADGYELGEWYFYLIDRKGNLQFWDEDGHCATARRMD